MDVNKAFADYKRVINGEKLGTGTKIVAGEPAGEPASDNKLLKKTVHFLAGAAIGSLEFIGKFVLLVLEPSLNMRYHGSKPLWGSSYGYYHARRVNNQMKNK